VSFEESTRREHDALLMALRLSYAAIEREGLAAARAGDSATKRTAQEALTVALEAYLQSLNTFVDDAIATAAMLTKPTAVTVTDHRLQREDRLTTLEQRFGFKRQELSDWAAVDKTNAQVRAVKHRLGLTMRVGTTTPLSIEDAVELDLTGLSNRVDQSYSWIVALGRACKLIAGT
jgi:hypothetical protein